jgi:hypothetical protein
MYTEKSFTDVIDKAIRSRVVTVTFEDNGVELTQSFRFSIGTEDIIVKKTVKQFLDELNFEFTPITGRITDVPPDPEPEPPTAEEIEKARLEKARQELEIAKKDLTLGLITQEEYDAKLATVKSGGL